MYSQTGEQSMNFSDPKVAAVFADYVARDIDEQARMKSGGPNALGFRDELLLPIGAEAGAFLHSLILARKPKRILELGTSYGYSTLVMADAARAVGGTLITMELADYKQAYAREQLAKAELEGAVDFRCGDAVEMIKADPGPFDFILLDIWKELYSPCFDAFYPKLSEEAIIASDNMITPEMARPDVRVYREAVRAKPDLQTVLLPIGQGIELSVKWSAGNGKL
jgi:predicted O-methyltransferase YrrM